MDFTGIDIQVVQKWLAIMWLIAAGPVIVAALPLEALEPLRKLLWPFMRRGKLLRSNESPKRGLLQFTVPQGFFTHFYVLGLAWNSILFLSSIGFAIICSRSKRINVGSVAALLIGSGGSEFSRNGSIVEGYEKEAWRLLFLLLLVEIHLIRRLYECLFVSSFDSSARMNLFGYFIAMGFYFAMPFTLFVQSFQDDGFFHAFKACLIHKLNRRVPSADTGLDFGDIIFILGKIGWMGYLGAALCLYGFIHQTACHNILASLRLNGKLKSVERYGIPRGDWFEMVSSAHYLAEIVIYAGFLLASGATHPAMWILFFGVVANLYLLAKPAHEWYLSKFDDYPKKRWALFPYIS